MQEPELYMAPPEHNSDANVLSMPDMARGTMVDNDSYLRGWRLHLVTLRSVRLRVLLILDRSLRKFLQHLPMFISCKQRGHGRRDRLGITRQRPQWD